MIPLSRPTSSPSENREEEKIKLSQEIIENLPIFTMKSDLADANNPKSKNIPVSPSVEQARAQIKTPQAPEKQSSSPFLNQGASTANTTVEKRTAVPVQQAKKEPNWEKLILAGIVCFLLLAFGAGGYYYWISKKNNQSEEIIETPPPIAQEETITFSIEKPNYLPIDIANSDSEKIKGLLSKYKDKVSASKALAPVEFIVTDSKNNPVNFATFASKLGINFSQDIISSLNADDKFSLFIYNDKESTRLGLTITSADDYKLKKAIFQEEASITKEAEPLFLGISYDLGSKSFASSSYNGTEIRYINLSADSELSIDYTIFQNKLVIGTTKTTLRSIMDYIKNHSQINSSSTTLNNSSTAPEND
jgi:hypothetical protein